MAAVQRRVCQKKQLEGGVRGRRGQRILAVLCQEVFHPIIFSVRSSLVFGQLLRDKNSELLLTLVSTAEQRLVLDTDLKKQRATDEEYPVRKIPSRGGLEKLSCSGLSIRRFWSQTNASVC